MLKNKGIKFFLIIMMSVFALGVILGSIYAADISAETESEIYEYLSAFLANDIRGKGEIAFTSFLNNLKVFAFIFAAGFFRFGMPITLGVSCMEGFVSGFTAATLIKLMGFKGFLISMSSMASVLIFVINLIFYGAVSMSYGLSEEKFEKNTKKNYMLISFFAVTIFCIASFFDGYISTTFMNVVVTKM